MSIDELIERLKKARKIVCNLCADGRCPRMSIPAQQDDEDLVICAAIDDAIKELTQGAKKTIP